MLDVNPHVEVEAFEEKLTSENALRILDGYDVVSGNVDKTNSSLKCRVGPANPDYLFVDGRKVSEVSLYSVLETDKKCSKKRGCPTLFQHFARMPGHLTHVTEYQHNQRLQTFDTGKSE